MSSMESITIVGNLKGSPRKGFMTSGSEVCNFTMATNRNWTDPNGVAHETTTWWKVSDVRTAAASNQYLYEGRQVMVQGHMVTDDNGNPRIWFAREDVNRENPRTSYEIRADRVVFLGPTPAQNEVLKASRAQQGQVRQAQSNGQPAPQQTAPAVPVADPTDGIPWD